MKIGPLVTVFGACLMVAVYPDGAGYRAAARADCSAITSANIDDASGSTIGMLGTHNSYHVAPPPAVLATLGERGRALEYTHKPLLTQLSELGIRQFELDVFADPAGARYAKPAALRTVKGLEPPGPELFAPGFKVLHVQDIDYRTTCASLVACLTVIRDWSRSNRWHVPILVMIEVKDGTIADPDGVGFVKPIPIDGDALRALDQEIRSVFDDGITS